jgi:pimeloyl-ACP methyl ester carboxylesterase
MNGLQFMAIGLLSWIGGYAGAHAAADLKLKPGGDTVVLIHGLGRSSLTMKRLERELKKCGYQVFNLSYPSTKLPIEEICTRYLAPLLEAGLSDSTCEIHFVTHSLGGIVLRQYLADHPLPNLGRVVMLGPPNHGSEVVDCLKKCWLGRCVLGPGGCQLGTTAEDLPQRLGPVNFSLGVIAGDHSWNPWFSLLIPGKDDGKVSVASTKVEGMSDFLLSHGSHTWLMWRRENIKQSVFFLEHGHFDQP